MPSLEKSLRNQLERTVKDAREVAEAGARAAIEQLGVGEAATPDHLDPSERNLRKRLRIHGRQLGDETGAKKGSQGIERLIEEVAYEHWHRMLFARFLAENNLLMYPDPEEPVAVSLAECDDLAADERARNGWELASRFAAKMLPAIFRVESPVFGLQLPPEHQQRLERLVSGLPTEVFTASDSLGWVYQFWQANRKEAINKSEVKIGARELPAVTQLFTEDYMVDFLLDNTLGAWHAGKILADNTKLAETAQDEQTLRDAVSLPGCPWNYLRFIRPDSSQAEGEEPPLSADDETDEQRTVDSQSAWRPAVGTFDGWPKTAKELKCLDPCMGSGHFVVAMFERLVALRMADEGLDETDAVACVIRDNLFGLEIDPRCTQIAAFNLALAAWRRIGYQILPPVSLACSGLAPNTTLEEWLALAGGNEKLESGMERLYRLFENAPVLGSLINPHTSEGTLLEADFDELQPLLEQALARETTDDSTREVAVTARGLTKAAEILAAQFTLVATNVPFLGYREMNDVLIQYVSTTFPDEKGDLGYCLWRRIQAFVNTGQSTALVTLQHWTSLRSYTAMRENLLKTHAVEAVAHLGVSAFETITGEKVNVTLSICTKSTRALDGKILLFDAANEATIFGKVKSLQEGFVKTTDQCRQLQNPDHRISFGELVDLPLLSKYAYCLAGIMNGDSPKFIRTFWELQVKCDLWAFLQSTVVQGTDIGGLESVILFDEVNGHLREDATIRRIKLHNADERGNSVWGCSGVGISQMSSLPASRYFGNKYDSNLAVVVPKQKEHLHAIWAFCSDRAFHDAVRAIDRKLNVTNATFGKVPFDLPYWEAVSAKRFPLGLPKPFSSDPTQWLFNGHPRGSDSPLQVAVARLVGYQWPRQTGSSFPDCPALGPDGLESHADQDGIVCIPPVRGEAGAADRLLNLLAAAYGDQWSSDVLNQLLAEAGYAGKGLDVWLRDGFFTQHIDIFHRRPFVWHIWDGLRDGFAALVNYHKLDRKNLETLIYTYLGNWIDRQKRDIADQVDGAEEKLVAAEQLKKRLELILHGEAPYDIFVRWKPLHQQPIGWQPDINDGVRMNIRPFVTVPDVKAKGAGILRVNPKIKWDKDRGKEPERPKHDYPWFWGWDGKTTDFTGGPDFKGERFNECHYTLDVKRRAKAKADKE